jgi:signal transduction histidine kinase
MDPLHPSGAAHVVRAADARRAVAAYRATMQHATATLRNGPRAVHWNQDYADIALALAIAIFALASAGRDHVQVDILSLPLLLLQTLPVAVRRRDPMKVLYVTGSAITIYSLLGYGDSSAGLGIFIAFYTVATHMSRRRATIAAAVTAAGIFISFASYAAQHQMTGGWTTSMTSTYFSFAVAWLIGDNLRVRRAYTRELEDRAVDLERERGEKAAQAVSEERARIARELHDVVAHYVSVMVVQAAGARRVVDKDPLAAKGALEAVEVAGRTALTEMRRMLEVLRADDPGMGPQPGLGEIDRLISNVRDAGLPVELSIEGSACCLPVGMDLAAYRIVQEALTNSVKHGGRASAHVSVRYSDDHIEIEVVDDGRGAAAQLLSAREGSGHGLIGMKERVGLFGGVLEAGPVLTGGYRVYAKMPLEPEDAARAKSEREKTLAAANASAGSQKRPAATHKPAVERSDQQRSMPPLMVRVLPPHSRDNDHSRRRERGEI